MPACAYMKPNLDLLRAVAVLFVLLSHVIRVVDGDRSGVMYLFGQLGVMLFFVHTSLVLMQSMERQHLEGATLFKQFYVQRIFRIYPLSIVFVLAILVLGTEHWTPLETFSNLALTQNLTYSRYVSDVMWSLPLEVQMYIALPFLYLIFRHRPARWLLGLWVLSIPMALLPPLVSLRLTVLSFVPCFLGGVIAWRMQGNARFPAWLWPILLAICSLAFVKFAEPRHDMYGRWIVCLALGLIIPRMRELRARGLNFTSKTIAKYSYGIYLFHYPLLDLAFKTLSGRPPALQWTVFVGLLLALPFAGYHLIEHPMIKLGHAWRQKVRPAAAPPAAQAGNR